MPNSPSLISNPTAFLNGIVTPKKDRGRLIVEPNFISEIPSVIVRMERMTILHK